MTNFRHAVLRHRAIQHTMSGIIFSLTVMVTMSMLVSTGWAGKKGGGYGHDPATKLEKLTKKLSLTQEQQEKILPILEEKSQKMKALHEQMKEARQQAIGKIEAELTPDQRETFKKMREDRRKRMEEYRDKHRRGHKKGKHHDDDDHDDDHD